MLVPLVVLGECSEQPPKPQPIPFISPNFPYIKLPLLRITTQKTKKHIARSKKGPITKDIGPGGSPNKVGDEAINKEMLDSVERAASTASSLEAEQASGNINKTQFTATLNESFYLELSLVVVLGAKKPWGGHTLGSGEDNMEHQFELMDNVPNTPHDSPLLRVNTPGSGEGNLELNELMDLVTKLSHRVFNLEKVKIAQAKEITQGQIGTDDTKVVKGSGDTKVLDTEKAVNTAGEGEEKAKEKGVVIIDVEDSSRLVRSITTLQPLPIINPKDKGKGILQETESVEKTKKKVQGDAQMERDAEVALRLQAKLDEELRVERERQEEASKVAIAEMFDEVQARMDVDYELAARMTQKEQEKYTIKEGARYWQNSFKGERIS
ncbi:hypothetical protein Tco_0267245 [Tanacetum coccineum]